MILLALLVATAPACTGVPAGSSTAAPLATSGGQRIDLSLTGGLSARLAAPWIANNCTLTAASSTLFCELTTADTNYHVYVNLPHYAGPRRYAANGEGAKGSENIVAGVSLGIRDTAEVFLPVSGNVVISKADKHPGGPGAGAMVTGAIDAVVQDKSGSAAAVKDSVHISGTFSTSLIGSP